MLGLSLALFAILLNHDLRDGAPPWIRTEMDPTATRAYLVHVRNAPDFLFVFEDGGVMAGTNTMRVDARGGATYTFVVSHNGSAGRREIQFTVDPTTLADLRSLIDDIHFFRRNRAFAASIYDGTQRTITVKANGIEKSVYCDNYFPAFEERIRGFVSDRILKPHEAEIVAAAGSKAKQGDP